MSCGKKWESYKPFAQVFVNFCWGDSLHQLIPLYLEKIEVKVCEKHSFLRKLEHTPRPWISCIWFENPFTNWILGVLWVVCWIFFSTLFFFEGCIGETEMHVLIESVGSLKFISWRSMCQWEHLLMQEVVCTGTGGFVFLFVWYNMFDGKHPAQVDPVNIRLFKGFIHARWWRISSQRYQLKCSAHVGVLQKHVWYYCILRDLNTSRYSCIRWYIYLTCTT